MLHVGNGRGQQRTVYPLTSDALVGNQMVFSLNQLFFCDFQSGSELNPITPLAAVLRLRNHAEADHEKHGEYD